MRIDRQKKPPKKLKVDFLAPKSVSYCTLKNVTFLPKH